MNNNIKDRKAARLHELVNAFEEYKGEYRAKPGATLRDTLADYKRYLLRTIAHSDLVYVNLRSPAPEQPHGFRLMDIAVFENMPAINELLKPDIIA